MKFSENDLVLAEKPYVSIQGEGLQVGLPMAFVRLQGCNVGCDWCDSYYTWMPHNMDKVPKEIKSKSITVSFKELEKMIDDLSVCHVWFTGGEPTLQAKALANYLKQAKVDEHIYHICTAGWIYNEELFERLDNIVIDLKAPSSKTSSAIKTVDKIVENFSKKIELKAVIARTQEDMKFAESLEEKYPGIDKTFQPLYVSQVEITKNKLKQVDLSEWDFASFAEWIFTNDVFRNGSMVRMGLQLHKHIWPNKQRGI